MSSVILKGRKKNEKGNAFYAFWMCGFCHGVQFGGTYGPSGCGGFNLDTSNIETELANCRAVYEKYYSELFTGEQDPRELVKTIDAELETAGWETIREEAQKQIDAQK